MAVEVMMREFASSAVALSRNPLGIIGLFLVLVYALAVVALNSTALTPTERMPLIWFLVLFPFVVFAGFVWLVARFHTHLYAPSDFSDQDAFLRLVETRRAVPPGESRLFSQIEEILADRFSSTRLIEALSEVGSLGDRDKVEREVGRLLRTEALATAETIREEGFLTIDSRPLDPEKGKVWQLPFDQGQSVASLLDRIWFALRPLGVPPHTYSTTWVLRDVVAGHRFTAIGSRAAMAEGIGSRDIRPLETVGLRPGMVLETVPVGSLDSLQSG